MNNKQLAQQAWQDYCKGFAIDPNKIENINLIAYAFKHAFVLGMNAAEQEPKEKPYFKPVQMEGIPLPLEKKAVKTGFKRSHKGRISRTYKQRKGEAHYLARMLCDSGEWKLQSIIKQMRDAGFIDWNENNSSGFVKDAMKYYPQIKRIGYGLYKYEE